MGTSKVGAISKVQKAQPLGFLKIQFVAKDQKIEEGGGRGPFGDIKNFRKTKNENFQAVS